MLNKNQKGIGHVALFVVIVLFAAVGFAGWRVYQSQINDEPATQKTTEENTERQSANNKPDAQMTTYSMDSSFPEKLSFTYPKAWVLSEKTDEGELPLEPGETVFQTVTITSPSKKYTVQYDVIANSGLGGSCTPDEASKIESIDGLSLGEFPDASFVETIYSKNSKYGYFSGIMETKSIADVKPEDSVCEIYLDQVIKLSGKENFTLTGAVIKIDGLGEPGVDSAYSSNDTPAKSVIEKAFNTKEYKQAVDTIKSTSFSGSIIVD